MWIKICGIKSVGAALCCAEAGADAVGFVFAESRRQVSARQAAEIIKAIPPVIEKVGVFVDQSYSDIAAIDDFLNLDLLQFHGTESPQFCEMFSNRVIKSFRIAISADLDDVKSYRGRVKACLLDSYEAGQAGGTGKVWNWSMLSNQVKKQLSDFNLILAGGLSAENVRSALQQFNPYGVDVSSGVETAGQKDFDLIRNFIHTVRRWENEQSA